MKIYTRNKLAKLLIIVVILLTIVSWLYFRWGIQQEMKQRSIEFLRYVISSKDNDGATSVYNELYEELGNISSDKLGRDDCPDEVILALYSGRLGNRFIQYLAARVISIAQQKPISVDLEWMKTYTPYFTGLQAIPINETELNIRCLINPKMWQIRNIGEFQKSNYLVPLAGKYTKIGGYPAHIPSAIWKLVFKHRASFLQEFQWREEFIGKVKKHIRNITEGREYSTLVGIHARLTDYLNLLTIFNKTFHKAERDYFDRAKQHFKERYGNPLFLVVSDDLDWCKKNLQDNDVIFAGRGNQTDPGWDLAILASCDHLLMTYGSFAMTAGYFVKGEVIIADNFSSTDGLNEQLKPAEPPRWTWFPVIANSTTKA